MSLQATPASAHRRSGGRSDRDVSAAHGFGVWNYRLTVAFASKSNKYKEAFVNRIIIGLSTAAAVAILPQLALADGDGAVQGGVGGAVAGAIVGGPVGAAVGGAAGMAVGGAASGPDRKVVVEPAPAPGAIIERRAADVPPGASDTKTITRDGDGCVSRSDTKTDGMGGAVTRSKTNC